ncbi:MAG TPA: deoxyribodipyrimidine photo-lyase, partial [Solirubrobacteraceae bacterium]|nr:deoxyribodipyrimidine photo-lyase [Solirubrobacteraceae bacterium]
MPTTALVWFRRDLRVHDHPALTSAHRDCDRVVPVFVLDRRLLDGGRFPSANRAWFLLESLRALRAALRERGGDLFLRAGRPEDALPALAAQTSAEAVYFAPDVSPFARARDRRVEAALGRVEARRRPGNFVADVASPRTADGRPYTVFSPFRRDWERLRRRPVHGAPRAVEVPAGLEP